MNLHLQKTIFWSFSVRLKTLVLPIAIVVLNASLLFGQVDKSRTFTWQNATFLSALRSAPLEKKGNLQTRSQNQTQDAVIDLPMLDGSSKPFHFVESPVMEAGLESNWIPVKTYQGHSEDLFTTVRLSVSEYGVTAFYNTPQGIFILEPVNLANQSYKISKEMPADFQCGTEGTRHSVLALQTRAACGSWGGTRRDYRIAIAATGEYTTARGGTAQAQADIVNVINILNVIYEAELGVHFNLADNNDKIIYTNPVTDPFTPPIGSVLGAGEASFGFFSDQLKTVMPKSNYDLGHVIHAAPTLAGGQARLNSVCTEANASAWSQIRASGDNYPNALAYIVVHEVGHQFGANHPYFGNEASCANRHAPTAYEPGSGTSLMSYHDVCGSQNIDPSPMITLSTAASTVNSNRNYHFHTVNLNEMITVINGHTCPVKTETNNKPPVATANPGGSTILSIPTRTPFELTGSGSDADNNSLTYCWEQYDTDPTSGGAAPNAAATTTNQPLFRTFSPQSSPTRTFPQLSDIAGNKQTIGEILPQVARMMKMRLTVRDRYIFDGLTLGGWACDDITINVVDVGSTGFTVTSQNTATTWTAGSSQNVTWNIAGTNVGAINCGKVNILMSVDGGNTFPIILVSNTDNDGTESITVPAGVNATTMARIRVESNCNPNLKFFNINTSNITITNPNCSSVLSLISPTTPLTAASGDAALNLGLKNIVRGAPLTTMPLTVTAVSPTMDEIGSTTASATTCEIKSNIKKAYSAVAFTPSISGRYYFDLTGPNKEGWHIHLFNSTFDPANPCASFVSTSYEGGILSYSVGGPVLNASETYYLVLQQSGGTLSGIPTITYRSLPEGGIAYIISSAPTTGGYAYTYLAVNTATNIIAAVSPASDFKTLSNGSYKIYGLSYLTTGIGSIDPATLVGQNQGALATNCAVLSTNFKQLGVCTPPSVPIVELATVPCPTAGNWKIKNFDPNVVYTFETNIPIINAGPYVYTFKGVKGIIGSYDVGRTYTVRASSGNGCVSAPSAPFKPTALPPAIAPPTSTSSSFVGTGAGGSSLLEDEAYYPILVTTPATCSSPSITTIANYESNLSYFFTPTGPIVDANGVIKGATIGVEYIVVADNGECFSEDSDPFTSTAQLNCFPYISCAEPTTITPDRLTFGGVPATKPTLVATIPATITSSDKTFDIPCETNALPTGYPLGASYSFALAAQSDRVVVRSFVADFGGGLSSSCQQVFFILKADCSKAFKPQDVTAVCINGVPYTKPEDGFNATTRFKGTGYPISNFGTEITEGSISLTSSYTDGAIVNGVFTRTWTIKDKCGVNCGTFTQKITINCANTPLLAISGSINKETGESVPATVKVFQANTAMMDMQGSSYLFNQLQTGNSYRIQPERDNDVMNGVTTFDIALLSKHILDIQPFTSPYQMIAADVNRDGGIDASDMVLIRNLILRRITRFPSNTAWRFIPKNFVFADNKNPFADDFPEVLNYNNLSSNMDKADFVAVKVGDVNLNAKTADIFSFATRTARPTENIYLTDKKMEAGKEYIFEVNIKNSTLKALQMALKIDKSNVASFSVEAGDLPQFETGNLEVNQKQGIVGMAWANTSKEILLAGNSIIQLRITPRQSAWLHELVSLDEQNMDNLVYDTEGGVEKQIQLKFNTLKAENPEFDLHQNRPNPFTTETTISFTLPETNNASLSIYDVNGREIYSLKQAFNKGYNEVKLDNTILKNAGIYFYRLQSDKFTAVKRMQFFMN